MVKEMFIQIIPEIEFAKHRQKPEIIFFKSTRKKFLGQCEFSHKEIEI